MYAKLNGSKSVPGDSAIIITFCNHAKLNGSKSDTVAADFDTLFCNHAKLNGPKSSNPHGLNMVFGEYLENFTLRQQNLP